MKANTFNVDMKLFGAKFAGLDSNEQAEFFKGLAMELSTWESRTLIQMQFVGIDKELSDAEKDELFNAFQMIMPEGELK